MSMFWLTWSRFCLPVLSQLSAAYAAAPPPNKTIAAKNVTIIAEIFFILDSPYSCLVKKQKFTFIILTLTI